MHLHSAITAFILLMIGDFVLSEEKCIRFSGCNNSVLTTVNSTVTLSLKLENLCRTERFAVDKITVAVNRMSGYHPPEIFCELILEENKICTPDASCWCQPEDKRIVISRKIADPVKEVWTVSADVYKGKQKSIVGWTLDAIIDGKEVKSGRTQFSQALCDETINISHIDYLSSTTITNKKNNDDDSSSKSNNSSGLIGYILTGFAIIFLALDVVVVFVLRKLVFKAYYKRKGRRNTYTMKPEYSNACPTTILRTCRQLPNDTNESGQKGYLPQVSLPVALGSSTVKQALMPPARLRA